MASTDPSEPQPESEPVQPRVRDALIGAAIGLLLIYGGTRIPWRFLSWLVIGIGILFVVVMSAFVISVIWTKASPSGRRLWSRVSGHVRHDPQLGTLTRDVRARCWEAAFQVRHGTVEVLIDGTDEPDPQLLARARELVADFAALESRLADYLAQSAKDDDDAEFAAEIGALRVSTIILRPAERPGEAVAVLAFWGRDERYWTCEYADGRLTGLDYD